MDYQLFINENYLTFLLLGGLLIVMYAYRDVHLPATGNFLWIILVMTVMCISSGIEQWAAQSPELIDIRVLTSVIHYVLQPLVIYLELIIIMPEHESKDKTRRFLLALPLIINAVVYLAAPFTGTLVFSYDSDYCFNRGVLGYTVYYVTFIYLALLLLWSIRFLRENDRRKSIILFFIVGTAVLTGILEATNIASGYIDETFALGIFLYYMYLVTLHESEMQADLANKELRLSQSKVKLLREQIQPHFIFNSLQIIKSLIRTDREKAVLCLEDFSDYLQANLGALRSDTLISFEEELEHIKAYVSLALADDTRNIDVQYEIEEKDFMIPPLTIEPLVENALQHGVMNEGTVRISTHAENDAVVITVSDNGRGFRHLPDMTDSGSTGNSSDAAGISGTDGTGISGSVSEREEKRRGIGIENARSRLATLCGGTLDIESSEKGTVVTVRVSPTNSGLTLLQKGPVGEHL